LYRELLRGKELTEKVLGQGNISQSNLNESWERVRAWVKIGMLGSLSPTRENVERYLQTALQQLADKLFRLIKEKLLGKEGLLRSGFRKRYRLSARGIAVPDPKLSLDEVLVPPKVLSRLFPDGNWPEYVLVNRNPAISITSALGFRVIPREDDLAVIGIHPVVMSLFQGDFDGDCLNLFFPTGSEAQRELKMIRPSCVLWEDGALKVRLKQELEGLKDLPQNAVALEKAIRERFTAAPKDLAYSHSFFDYPVSFPSKQEWYAQAREARKALVRGKLGVKEAGHNQFLLAQALFDLPDREGLRAAMVIGEAINQLCLNAELDPDKDYLRLLMKGEDLEKAARFMAKAGIPERYINLVVHELQATGETIEALARRHITRTALSRALAGAGLGPILEAARKGIEEPYDLQALIYAGCPGPNTTKWPVLPGPGPSLPSLKKKPSSPLVKFIANPRDASRGVVPVLLRLPKGSRERRRDILTKAKRCLHLSPEELKSLQRYYAELPDGSIHNIPDAVQIVKSSFGRRSSPK